MTSSNKRPCSSSPSPISDSSINGEGAPSSSKKRRTSPPSSSSTVNDEGGTKPNSVQSKIISLHSWLHPSLPEPIQSHSPALHSSSSTFLSFTISFVPPSHITALPSLEKECRRIVRELDVISLVGSTLLESDEGAFANGEGRIQSQGKNKGKHRAREPDHRIWACRTLTLKEGKDGTGGEGDYQLLEASFDDNEKYGGQTILKTLRENNGIDVLSICCRWYGGEMIGPIRFQHISTTVLTSLRMTLKSMTLRDLRTNLESLDEEIGQLRTSLLSSAKDDSSSSQVNGSEFTQIQGKYDDIDDEKKLERLVIARERTKEALEKKLTSQGS
ncbi:uncharacterized protein IL334_004188 [Kwoniella shivajii]|uniref:Impact N-terminal domain-containing protein n=1 Tax=Kwoniella shivajii TaxID=564305 RepID=A0ABZ1CZM9_9TREE|nr:hypothetical protein IL334_004188 [Kwoniella shivajii]